MVFVLVSRSRTSSLKALSISVEKDSTNFSKLRSDGSFIPMDSSDISIRSTRNLSIFRLEKSYNIFCFLQVTFGSMFKLDVVKMSE